MMKLFSPAKINLFLRVLKKREDGYHELASLFQAVDLFDELIIEESDHDTFVCSNPNIPTDEKNLVNKALKLFRAKTKVDKKLSIRLTKHIPTEAGLGGGSSNAATALFAFNAIFKTGLENQELAKMGRELGADVPFFFSSGTSYCEGVGEIITDVSIASFKQPLWLVKPDFGLSTPSVFQRLQASLLPARDPLQALASFQKGEGEFYNDLEIPSFELEPKLLDVKMRLLKFTPKAVMTGSGSSFYALGDIDPMAFPDCFTRRVYPTAANPSGWYKGPSEAEE